MMKNPLIPFYNHHKIKNFANICLSFSKFLYDYKCLELPKILQLLADIMYYNNKMTIHISTWSDQFGFALFHMMKCTIV